MIEQTVELTAAGAVKLKLLNHVPKALHKVLSRWGAESVHVVRVTSDSIFSTGRNRRTGHLRRNIAFAVTGDVAKGTAAVTVGTGVGNTKTVVYADVQDRGGTITHKRAANLAIPLQPGLGSPRNYKLRLAIINGKKFLVSDQWQKVRGGENSRRTGKLIFFFLLKPQVTLPPTGWFTQPIRQRRAVLNQDLQPENVLKVAETTGEE